MIYALALELNLEKDGVEEWRQLTVLMNVCIKDLKNKSHDEAIKQLKLIFGDPED